MALGRGEELLVLPVLLEACRERAKAEGYAVLLKPYYDNGQQVIYHGDCREILPQLEKVDLVLTDPPYGIGATSMTLGIGKREFTRGEWDNERPDVRPLLDAGGLICIWGGNYFADMLAPTNDWLVWHKNNDGRSFSECELAWTNFRCQTRHLTHHWGGEEKEHPTQKPLSVISWSMGWAQNAVTVLDPYMGSGTTLVVAKATGRSAIGIDLCEAYCEIAAKRLENTTPSLFAGAM